MGHDNLLDLRCWVELQLLLFKYMTSFLYPSHQSLLLSSCLRVATFLEALFLDREREPLGQGIFRALLGKPLHNHSFSSGFFTILDMRKEIGQLWRTIDHWIIECAQESSKKMSDRLNWLSLLKGSWGLDLYTPCLEGWSWVLPSWKTFGPLEKRLYQTQMKMNWEWNRFTEAFVRLKSLKLWYHVKKDRIGCESKGETEYESK